MTDPRPVVGRLGSSVAVVFGGTGAQGKGVVDALLSSALWWSIRAVTRDTTSDKAKRLLDLVEERKAQGTLGHSQTTLELVRGEFGDRESITQCLQDVDAVFLNMDYWTLGREKEVEFGCQVADIIAARSAPPPHIVYSGLEYVSKITGGKLECDFYDSKAEVAHYFRETKGLQRLTVVKFSTYMENFIAGHTALKREVIEGEEAVVFAFPAQESVGVTLIAAHDAGRVIVKLIEEERESGGNPPRGYKDFGLAGDHLNSKQMVEIFERVMKEEAESEPRVIRRAICRETSLEDLKERNLQGGNMWEFKIEHEQLFADYVRQTREIVSDVLTFEQWLRQNKR